MLYIFFLIKAVRYQWKNQKPDYFVFGITLITAAFLVNAWGYHSVLIKSITFASVVSVLSIWGIYLLNRRVNSK